MRNRKTQVKDIRRCQLKGANHLEEFLSYDILTDIGIRMGPVALVNDLNHSIFYSIANEIMNWPYFLGFVTIDNDEEEDEKYN